MLNQYVEGADNRRQFLARWRMERNLDRWLSDDEIADRIESDPSDEMRASFTAEVRAGDVRLLPDALASDTTAPRYVAVIADCGQCVVCAPFSRYSTPATSNEWLTGFKSPTLRVLQLWNAQPCARDAVAKSWKVAELSESQLARAQKLYTHSLNGTLPDANDREDIGLAVESRYDERNDYMTDEYRAFAPLFASWTELVETEPAETDVKERISEYMMLPPLKPFVSFRDDLRIAAGEAERDFFKEGHVAETGLRISIEVEREEQVLRVRVCAADDRPSLEMDGWTLYAGDGHAFGTVCDGKLICPNVSVDMLTADGRLCLISPTGDVRGIVEP